MSAASSPRFKRELRNSSVIGWFGRRKRAEPALVATRARSSRSVLARSPSANCALLASHTPESGGAVGGVGDGGLVADPLSDAGIGDVGVVPPQAVARQEAASAPAARITRHFTSASTSNSRQPLLEFITRDLSPAPAGRSFAG